MTSRYIDLVYILSEPRSGSTVLSTMLDRRKGVVCVPESSFPQVLGLIDESYRRDPLLMAALYLASTFPPKPVPPTPLTLDDAAGCMKGTNRDILINLGLALAAKIGRNPAEITTVVWKATRVVGMHAGPLSTDGRFVVLRRSRLNVFESQFRVGWGLRNRHPYRYAVFARSYEHAFSKLPAEKTFLVDYESIPRQFPALLEACGIADQGEWESPGSSIDLSAKIIPWLTQCTDPFLNRDLEKRLSIPLRLRRSLDRAFLMTRPLRPFLGPLRAYYDKRTLREIFKDASDYYRTSCSTPPPTTSTQQLSS